MVTKGCNGKYSENTRKWLTETATAGATSAGNVATQTELSPNPDVMPHCNPQRNCWCPIDDRSCGSTHIKSTLRDPIDGNEVGEEALSI